MGKKWRNKKKNANNSGDRSKKAEGTGNVRGLGYDDIVKENKLFEEYYKKQGIVPEEEWDQFMATLRDPLPASFRVTGTRSQSQALLSIIRNDFLEMVEKQKAPAEGTEGESAPAEVPQVKHAVLPWYPDGLAFQLNLTRSDIRKSEAYYRLHNFLISETESGNISRQETVSMIPPLVLDVQPHHKVLDMCAAPGSKTAQLIEALHAEEAGRLPAGMVVANDADNKRCYMLVHQAKRLQSPCFVITNHDAAGMPSMLTAEDGVEQRLLFDRILCDVPCTGDGTLRKNTDVWPKWNPANGCNLHGLQYNIARRGLEMLAVGGRLVYSTCSLNPMEDEAVINRILLEMKGCVRLVDASDRLPGLRFSPGLTHWVAFSKDMKLYRRGDVIAPEHQTLIRPHMLPGETPEPELRKCMRILPHQQNTGGFFVAVLEKLSRLPHEAGGATVAAPARQTETKETSQETRGTNQETKEMGQKSKETDQESKETNQEPKETSQEIKETNREVKETNRESGRSPPRKKQRRIPGYKEDPYFFANKDDEMVLDLDGFYGLSEDLDRRLLMTRCEQGRRKNIYLCSPSVRDLISRNQQRLKIINSGIKVFARCDNKQTPCGYRLTQEGADSILPFLERRKVTVTPQDLATILQYDDVELPAEVKLLDPSTQQALEPIGPGAIALLVDAHVPGTERHVRTRVVGWRGATSIRAYVQRNERIHLLRLLGADTSKYEKNKFAQARGEENSTKPKTFTVDVTEEADDVIVEVEAGEPPAEGVQ